MKKLLLLRHGESGWGNFTIPDFERTLTEKGIQEAIAVAEYLQLQSIFPDAIICSSAQRTSQTAYAIAHQIEYPISQMIYEPLLYNASKKTLLNYIENLDDSIHTVLLIGHNNGLSDIVNLLHKNDFITLPTCGICATILNTSHWKNSFDAQANVEFYYYPPNLMS